MGITATVLFCSLTHHVVRICQGINRQANRPAIASMSDYYPFGMLMPSRHFEDNNGHTTTATLTVLAPQLNSVTIPMSSSMVSILGFASVPSGAPLSVQASSAGDGVQYTVHPVSGGLPQNIQINVSSGASAGWRAVLTQGAYSSSILLTATGYNTLSFTAPMSGTAVLQIIHPTIVPLPGPTIIINDIILDTFIFVPTLVVSQISSDNEYKYGFNGQMRDNEWAGVGNHNTALFWEYDTRTARRANLDPVFHCSISSYSAFSNNPLRYKDPLGNDTSFATGGARKNFLDTKKIVDDKVAKMEMKILELENKGKEHRVARLREKIVPWKQMKSNFDDIISSNTMFYYRTNRPEEVGGATAYDFEEDRVDIATDGSGQTIIHESQHGAAFLRGEQTWYSIDGTNENTKMLAVDFMDEFNAFYLESVFSPGVHSEYLKQMNANSIYDLLKFSKAYRSYLIFDENLIKNGTNVKVGNILQSTPNFEFKIAKPK